MSCKPPTVGAEVQARPRLESTTRFQNLIAENDTGAFNLKPYFSELAAPLYDGALPARARAHAAECIQSGGAGAQSAHSQRGQAGGRADMQSGGALRALVGFL